MPIFTRELETTRFKAAPGMPLPARLDTVYGRKFLRERYGEDIITELDYRKPDNFLKMISKDSDLRDQFAKLKMVADTQAKTICDLAGK